jgi:hypothetical protein
MQGGTFLSEALRRCEAAFTCDGKSERVQITSAWE